VTGTRTGSAGEAAPAHASSATASDPFADLDALNVEYVRAARIAPGWEGAIDDDVLRVSADIPLAAVNMVARAHFTPDNVDRRISEVIAWFRRREKPIGWWVCERDTPADLAVHLVAHGFALEDTAPGMVADLTGIYAEQPPAGVSISRVREPAMLHVANTTMAAGFGAPPELADVFDAMGVLGFDDDVPTRTYLATLDGVPAATALGLLVGEVLGIFNVATIETARRRGIGRAVTRAALVDGAARGARRAILQSSEAGHGVYETLGFRDFGTYSLFQTPAP
jgi:ribosomal protein S18 acetylase RimI-like enzyme